MRGSGTPDSLAKKTHQARVARSGSDKKGPHYEFYTGNSDNLQDQIIDGARKHGVSVDIQPANNYAAEIWQWVIFIGLVGLLPADLRHLGRLAQHGAAGAGGGIVPRRGDRPGLAAAPQQGVALHEAALLSGQQAAR